MGDDVSPGVKGREGEQRGDAGNMRGRKGSFVMKKEGIERGKIVKKKFATGRNRPRHEEHGVHEQDWVELVYKERKIDSISRGQIRTPRKFFSRYQ